MRNVCGQRLAHACRRGPGIWLARIHGTALSVGKTGGCKATGASIRTAHPRQLVPAARPVIGQVSVTTDAVAHAGLLAVGSFADGLGLGAGPSSHEPW